MSADDRAWLADQVERYLAVLPRYARYAEVLDAVLRRATADLAPLAIVQARHKAVASFAEKCLRKRVKRPDPVAQFTDLAGARVIARTRSEVDAVCRYLEDHFEIDWEDSLDASARLRPSEFGYRSVHYIVTLRPDVDYGVEVPPEVLGLRAEIQARTIAEHAYSDVAHDLTYKGAFELPLAWRRELAGVAATLEEVDGVFTRLEGGLREYASSYGRFLSDADAAAEIERLAIVLEHDPANTGLAERLARLAMVRGDWDLVVRTLTPIARSGGDRAPSAVLRDLGTALCKRNRSEPDGAAYRAGQRYLERAGEFGDVDAICSLAGTWKGVDDARALALYRRGFELDPSNPYPLGNYLEMQLDREPGLIDSIRPLVRQSVERCRHQVAAGVNVPWARYDLARFHLLLDEPYEAIDHLAVAIEQSAAAWVLQTSLASLERLTRTLRAPGVEWARRLLLLALASRFDDDAARARVRDLATPGAPPLAGPVVIVAGGTDPRVEERMAAHRDLMRAALADVSGTVVSGGTAQGICGIVADVGRERGASLRTVGYLPAVLPGDATLDPGYTEIRRTGGDAFSPAEPLQNWTDLLASGVAPSSVRVLGVGGGRIAAAEYRIALALGATVGLVEDSGREAGRLLAEESRPGRGPVRLPADGETLRAFLAPPSGALGEEERVRVARGVHEAYRQERRRSQITVDPALAAWEDLPADLQASNLAQADAIGAKAARVGCVVVPAGTPGEPATFTDDEVEALAQAEHGRFVAERLVGGWRPGEVKDVAARTSPYLVPWAALAEDIRDRDREAVRAIPGLLAQVGLGLRRVAAG